MANQNRNESDSSRALRTAHTIGAGRSTARSAALKAAALHLDLLLEKVLEGLARIQRPRLWNFRGCLCGLHVRCRRGVFFYRGAKFVKRTLVLGVFRRNARGYRLGALELRAAIEKPALLTTVQLKIAFRTLALGIESGHKYRAAVRAARARYRAHHPWRARTKVIRSAARSALRRFALSILFFVSFLFFRFSIAAVAILAIHKRLRPSAATDCHSNLLHDWVKSTRFPDMIRSECFTCPAHQSSPLKLSWDAAGQKMGQLCL